MTDWNPRANHLFLQAIEMPPAEWPAFLQRACGDDSVLRQAVETMLGAHGRAGSFLAHPHADYTETHSPRHAPGEVVAGKYKLLQLIGEGGMGAVWMAEQREPVTRKVAVKLIRAEHGQSATILARFEAERQAIALMDHPNIARLLDAGTEAGQPYFVMELVKGIQLMVFCDTHKLGITERLNVFVQVCSAIQHAHQKGIIHRDLKPSNILVESHDGNPVPKVIDFGLAKATTGLKLTEHTLFTGFGAVLGTPLYMAPEQATFNAVDIDTRADVYALGVILYELLTGTTPLTRETIKKAAIDEVLRLIREQEAPMPSTRLSSSQSLPALAAGRQIEPNRLTSLVRGDLDWIVMKALEKDRSRRYESASSFSIDIKHHLAGEPVLAAPPSVRYRLRKYAKKHRAGLTLTASIALLVVAGVAATAWQAIRAGRAEAVALRERSNAIAERDQKEIARAAAQAAQQAEGTERRRAEEALERTEESLYWNRINLAYQYWQSSNLGQSSRILADCPKRFRNWEFDYVYRLCHSELFSLPGNGQFPMRVRFSKDGNRMASISEFGDAGVRVWDLSANKTLAEVSGVSISAGTISPDGTVVATGDREGGIAFWDATTGKRLRLLGKIEGDVGSLEFSPDGKWLAAARTDYTNGSSQIPFLKPSRNEALKVWNVATEQEVALDVNGTGVAAEFSPDGNWLLAFKKVPTLLPFTSTEEYTGILIDTSTWKESRVLCPFNCWAFNGNGTLLVLGGVDEERKPFVKGIDPITDNEEFVIQPTFFIGDVAISPDGKYLALAEAGIPNVRIWDVKAKKPLRQLRCHTEKINGIAFSPDGRLVTASQDNSIKFWDVTVDQSVNFLPGNGAQTATRAAFSPDGSQVAWVQGDNVSKPFALGTLGTVTLWDAKQAKIIHDLKGHTDGARRVAFSADGRILASGGRDHTARTWDVETGKALAIFRGHDHESWIEGLAVSPDGRWVASSHIPKENIDSSFGKAVFKKIPGSVKVWDSMTGQERFTLSGHESYVHQIAFSPNGNMLATYSYGMLKLWNLLTETEIRTIQTKSGNDGLVFSTDGERLLAIDESIIIWDVATGEQRQVVSGHRQGMRGCVAFSRDKQRLITGFGGDVRLWDSTNFQEILKLPRPESERGSTVVAVSFSQYGDQILAAMSDGSVLCWDTR